MNEHTDKPRSNSYDAVVIGGGHNGLVCAAYLAKAGKKVLVVERRQVLGGAAVSEETVKGFTFSTFSYVVSLFRPHIIRELDLVRHGLQIIPMETTYNPLPGDKGLVRWADSGKTRDEIARFSPKDASLYPEFGLAMGRLSRFTKNVIDTTAPQPASLDPRELMKMLRLGRHLRDLDPEMRYLNLKLLTMSAVDFLHEWFESEPLVPSMAGSGIIGTFLGIRSPGTAYVLLHHYMGEIDGAFRAWGFSKGGTGQISIACANAAESFGAEIIAGAGVDHVKIRNGRAVGVVLENGDEIKAATVISSLDPNRTFLKLVGERELPGEFVSNIRRYKNRGSSGKVNLALDRLPSFRDGRPGISHLKGDITIAPSVDYVERAYDEAKYGEFSKRPFLNIVIPSLSDPSVAPPGKHVLSAFVQYAPYNIREGAENWPEKRDAFGDAVIDTIEEFCPDIRECIVGKQVLSPWDIEKITGLTEGNIFQGELSLEQLAFLRPVAEWSRYRSPVRNLWMCGSGTHPGGGVMGAPGELAAKTMLGEGGV
ncbi:MAG: NAD(P)/FAD-dependent oxidoreductase [Acidobacteriota bacterium]|nr:MAG: NAD(P)/FAD-dependent oxidoreductase [Acidobacteriota bacterium]